LWQLVSLDAAGRVVQEVQGNSLVTETSRDIDGRVRFLKTGRFQGGAWSDLQQDYEYTYTPNGNMQTREDHLRAVTEIFHYDVLNRLTEIQNVRPSPTLPVPEPATWTIDEFGNIDYRS